MKRTRKSKNKNRIKDNIKSKTKINIEYLKNNIEEFKKEKLTKRYNSFNKIYKNISTENIINNLLFNNPIQNYHIIIIKL